nr:MAG TPA: hypothetical protein [Caudoviricetes sp.]
MKSISRLAHLFPGISAIPTLCPAFYFYCLFLNIPIDFYLCFFYSCVTGTAMPST